MLPRRSPRRERVRSSPPQPQQIAMQRHDLGMRFALAMIEFASLERRDVVRRGEDRRAAL